MEISGQTQEYKGYIYSITDLIFESQDFEIFELDVQFIHRNYYSPCEDDLDDFVRHCKYCLEADLSYPIILAPCNAILDGKHRLAKCLINDIKKIKAVKFEVMPSVGREINDKKTTI